MRATLSQFGPLLFVRRHWRAIRVLLSAAAVLAGILVILRPGASLDYLALLVGAGAIVEGLLTFFDRQRSARGRSVEAVSWIVAGGAILLTRTITVEILVYLVGSGLVLVGLARIALAFRAERTWDDRTATAAFGVAAIGFGSVSLVWRDISMIVVAISFGAWLLITGVQNGWDALRGTSKRPDPKPARRRGAFKRSVRTTFAITLVAASLLAVGVTVAVTRDDAVTDPFYAAPRDIPKQPGRLISAERFDRGVPAGATGWRILYTTTRENGAAAVASGLVVAPNTDAFHPVVTWAHGTTGTAQPCAPSLQPEPFKSGGMYALKQLTRQGLAVVATDYIGLGTTGEHAYLVGNDAAHAALDATRAAMQLQEASLSRRTVIWGHSQGGQAALAASDIASSYAPELRVLGTAAVSPASDLPALVDTIHEIQGGAVMASYVINAYAHTYRDIHLGEYVRAGSQVAVQEFAKRCLASPGTYASVISVAAMSSDPDIFKMDPRQGPLGMRLEENIPQPSGPLLLVQGASDPLILPRIQDAYASHLCRGGAEVDYRKLPGEDHVSMLYGNSAFLPDLIQWTKDRLNYSPARSTCS